MSNEPFSGTWWARRPTRGASAVVILVLEVIAVAASVVVLATDQYTATSAIVVQWVIIGLLSIDALRLIGGLVATRRGLW
jgi:hypothetical protein